MSAWLVSQDHINALVSFAIERGILINGNAAAILTEENMRSLRYRYPGRDFLAEWEEAAASYKFEHIDLAKALPKLIKSLHKEKNDVCGGRYGKLPPMSLRAVATQIIKACDCYDYQACEHDEYESSAAKEFVGHVRNKAIAMGGETEGALYDAMLWGLD